METINDFVRPKKKPALYFEMDPHGPPATYAIGGNSYPYTTQVDEVSRPSDIRYVTETVLSNADIEYTAVIIPNDTPITEYRWDFGDGTVGYGPVTSHKYLTASSQTQVTLRITLVDGRRYYASRVVNLKDGHLALANKYVASDSYPTP